MDNQSETNIGTILKQQRISVPLTLQELAGTAKVSASHLGRIERGERFPSAHILHKIAGYLSSDSPRTAERTPAYGNGQLDPYVARVLSQEPAEVQRAVIGILTILKSVAKSMNE